MSKFIFGFHFYTNGDYGFYFVPSSTEFKQIDCTVYRCTVYSYDRSYNNYEQAIRSINKLLNRLKDELYGKDWVVKELKEMINSFLEKLNTGSLNVFQSLSGNYEGTCLSFNKVANTVNCIFECDDDEEETMLREKLNEIDINEFKQNILKLHRETGR